MGDNSCLSKSFNIFSEMTSLCFMCHYKSSSHKNMKDHLKKHHNVLFELDLLLLMQFLTTEEKKLILKQKGHRLAVLETNQEVSNETFSKKTNIHQQVLGIEGDLKIDKDDIEIVEYVPKDVGNKAEQLLKIDLGKADYKESKDNPFLEEVVQYEAKYKVHENRRLTLDTVEDSVANKIRFWKEKESYSPKQPVHDFSPAAMFFDKVDTSTKNEKDLSNLLRRTLSQHVLGEKTADDRITIFDEIFATTCADDFDESVDGPFKLLLEDLDITGTERREPAETSIFRKEDVADDLDKTFSEEEVPREEVIIVKPRKIESKRPSEVSRESPSIIGTKYNCTNCGKSFKFLTSLKGHINSKVKCRGQTIKSTSNLTK